MSNIIDHAVDAISKLTFRNVAVLTLLVLTAFPAYVAYRVLEDENLRSAFVSSFEELPLSVSGCGVYRVKMAGGVTEYIVRHAFRNDDKGLWYIAIRSPKDVPKETVAQRCMVLRNLVAKARDAMGGHIQPEDLE